MERPHGLKILELCLVAPAPETTTSTTPTTLPLTFFDILWLRFPPVTRLFFYEFPQPTKSFFDSVLPKLKLSLSVTLQHYLPLAGNLLWPQDSLKPFIKYVPGDAVSLTVAESDDDFDYLAGNNLREALKSHPLIPHLAISHEKASVMSLQVTLFPNSGFSIGITTHHAVVDGKSSTDYLRKSWAHICSKLVESSPSPSPPLPEQFSPFFDRTVIQDSTGIDEIFAKEWLNQDGANNRSLAVWGSYQELQGKPIRGKFEMKPKDIENLKKYVESKLENNKVHFSTFTITCSYVLTCLVKAEQTQEERVVFIFGVDLRSRLEPKIPPTYFGNCIGGPKVVLETMELSGFNGLIYAIEGISEALDKLEDGVLNDAESWVSDMRSFHGDRIFTTAGSPRFEVYGVDFGWGRPKKVETPSIDKTGAFCLSERRDGNGGVGIELVLDKNKMEAFADLFADDLESF